MVMGLDDLFFQLLQNYRFPPRGERRPTSKPRAPGEGNEPRKRKKGGCSCFHGAPALVLGEALRAPEEKQNAPVCKTQAGARKLKITI